MACTLTRVFVVQSCLEHGLIVRNRTETVAIFKTKQNVEMLMPLWLWLLTEFWLTKCKQIFSTPTDSNNYPPPSFGYRVMVLYQVGLVMYRLLCFVLNCLSTLLEIIWFLCNFSSLLIPWLFAFILLLCLGSRFVRLREPPEQLVTKHLHKDENESQKFPVAFEGAGLDFPGNSLQAIKMASSRPK